MEFVIKKYESKDVEQLKELFDLSFEEKALMNIINNSILKFAYSAFLENKLVGVMFAWESSFHPHCTYFRILCNPFYAKLNVQERLLSKVKTLETIKAPLQTSIWETSFDMKSFYEKSGFKEIRRTYMPKLKLADISGEILFSDDEYIIKSLAEIQSGNELIERLSLGVKRNYENAHRVNPVANLGVEEWREMILEDDLIVNGSYVYLDREEKNIIAYSFLHESENPDSYELGWCGSLHIQDKGLISKLIHHQIEYSINKNVKVIMGEFDTTDVYAMEVLKTLPFSPCPTWITYQEI